MRNDEIKTFNKGIIDIGTNSCRLFISKVENKNSKIKILEKLYKETRITRLGNFINENNEITNEGVEKVVEIINYFKGISKEYEVEELISFATSAIREAANQKEILDEIENKTNIKPIVITGEEEGRLTFLGGSSEFKEDILLMDIGGGSTEFIYGNTKEIFYIESFKLGAVRETQTFFKNDNYSKIEKMKISVKNRLKDIQKLKEKKFILAGVAGTITTNVSVKEKMKIYNSEKVHLYKLTKKELEENLELYLSFSLDERKNLDGLQPERGENIIAGTLIILEVMEILNVDEIVACENDGLEGGMLVLPRIDFFNKI